MISSALTAIAACAGSQGTIGAVLGQRPDGRLFVRETPPDLAASKQGLEPGDEVLLIDGKDVRAMSEQALHDALSGDEGTLVKLTVVRGDDVLRMQIRRTPARRHRIAPP